MKCLRQEYMIRLSLEVITTIIYTYKRALLSVVKLASVNLELRCLMFGILN